MKFHEEGSDAVLPFPAKYHASSSIQNLLNAVKLIGWQAEQKTITVVDSRCAGRGRKTWRECVKDDMDELGLHSEWVVSRDMWRSLISGKTSDPS